MRYQRIEFNGKGGKSLWQADPKDFKELGEALCMEVWYPYDPNVPPPKEETDEILNIFK